jgi:hypothetical protein
MQSPGSPNPVTPTKPPGKDGAGYDNPDDEIVVIQSDEEEESRPKQNNRRALCVLVTYEVVQRWVTGGRATQPEEDIEREFFDLARHLMHLSGLKKLPCHKGLDTNLLLWKKAGVHTLCCVKYVLRLYLCQMRNRCRCMCCL